MVSWWLNALVESALQWINLRRRWITHASIRIIGESTNESTNSPYWTDSPYYARDLSTVSSRSISATVMDYALPLSVHEFSHIWVCYDLPSLVQVQNFREKITHFECSQSPEYKLIYMYCVVFFWEKFPRQHLLLFKCEKLKKMDACGAGKITLFGSRSPHYQMWCVTKIEITPVKVSTWFITEPMLRIVQYDKVQ